jgi:hypothetical protein
MAVGAPEWDVLGLGAAQEYPTVPLWIGSFKNITSEVSLWRP